MTRTPTWANPAGGKGFAVVDNEQPNTFGPSGRDLPVYHWKCAKALGCDPDAVDFDATRWGEINTYDCADSLEPGDVISCEACGEIMYAEPCAVVWRSDAVDADEADASGEGSTWWASEDDARGEFLASVVEPSGRVLVRSELLGVPVDQQPVDGMEAIDMITADQEVRDVVIGFAVEGGPFVRCATVVQLDAGEEFPCFAAAEVGAPWNGWATPRFTWEQFRAVVWFCASEWEFPVALSGDAHAPTVTMADDDPFTDPYVMAAHDGLYELSGWCWTLAA